MNKFGGILLAGGTGSRLFPNTIVSNKHLLPIYDKPMIYYSLSILLLSGIRDITIVCNSKDLDSFNLLLGNGEDLGIEITYSVQDSPDGIPDAINTAQSIKNYKRFMTVLGDNFLYGREFFSSLKNTIYNLDSNSFFYQKVKNPENFGIVKWNENSIVDVIEKPSEYISNDAIIGLYIFDNTFSEKFNTLKKSERGEYEILDIIKEYGLSSFNSEYIGRGTAWFDMGTNDDFFNCELFVKTLQDKQGLLICSPHEISYRNGWISKDRLFETLDNFKTSEYAENLYKYLDY